MLLAVDTGSNALPFARHAPPVSTACCSLESVRLRTPISTHYDSNPSSKYFKSAILLTHCVKHNFRFLWGNKGQEQRSSLV